MKVNLTCNSQTKNGKKYDNFAIDLMDGGAPIPIRFAFYNRKLVYKLVCKCNETEKKVSK